MRNTLLGLALVLFSGFLYATGAETDEKTRLEALLGNNPTKYQHTILSQCVHYANVNNISDYIGEGQDYSNLIFYDGVAELKPFLRKKLKTKEMAFIYFTIIASCINHGDFNQAYKYCVQFQKHAQSDPLYEHFKVMFTEIKSLSDGIENYENDKHKTDGKLWILSNKIFTFISKYPIFYPGSSSYYDFGLYGRYLERLSKEYPTSEFLLDIELEDIEDLSRIWSEGQPLSGDNIESLLASCEALRVKYKEHPRKAMIYDQIARILVEPIGFSNNFELDKSTIKRASDYFNDTVLKSPQSAEAKIAEHQLEEIGGYIAWNTIEFEIQLDKITYRNNDRVVYEIKIANRSPHLLELRSINGKALLDIRIAKYVDEKYWIWSDIKTIRQNKGNGKSAYIPIKPSNEYVETYVANVNLEAASTTRQAEFAGISEPGEYKLSATLHNTFINNRIDLEKIVVSSIFIIEP